MRWISRARSGWKVKGSRLSFLQQVAVVIRYGPDSPEVQRLRDARHDALRAGDRAGTFLYELRFAIAASRKQEMRTEVERHPEAMFELFV
jgi:hypothetical protein